MMKLEEIIRTGLSRVDTIAVKRTAINPALWLVGLITPLSLVLTAIIGDQVARWILFLLRCGPGSFTFVVYVVFMFRDPDRLQSEEYRVRQQALRYLYKKGGSTEIVDIANQVARIETSQSRLDGGEKNETFLLVFDDGSNSEIDLRSYVDSLDSGAEMYTLDGHVCFLKSNLSVSDLSGRLLKFSGSSLFFIVDVSSSEYEGRMLGVFWDFLKPRAFESAAE